LSKKFYSKKKLLEFISVNILGEFLEIPKVAAFGDLPIKLKNYPSVLDLSEISHQCIIKFLI